MHVSQSSEPERRRDVSIHLAHFVVRGTKSNGGACVVMRRELFVLLEARTHLPSLWAKARWSTSRDTGIYMMQKDYVLSQISLDLIRSKRNRFRYQPCQTKSWCYCAGLFEAWPVTGISLNNSKTLLQARTISVGRCKNAL